MTMIVETRCSDVESAWAVVPYLSEILRKATNPVFVCVGTPKIIGDSLGPRIGSMVLAEIPTLPLYGTVTYPVHALNLDTVLRDVQAAYPHATLIGIDSSLSAQARVGYICFHHGKLQPGRALHGGLPAFGEYRLYGNIGAGCEPSSHQALQHILEVSAEQVERMANVMSTIILQSWRNAYPSSPLSALAHPTNFAIPVSR